MYVLQSEIGLEWRLCREIFGACTYSYVRLLAGANISACYCWVHRYSVLTTVVGRQTELRHNATTFRGELMTVVRERLGIAAQFSAPYHPLSHGNVERAKRTITQTLRKFIWDHQGSWDKIRPLICHSLNTSVISSEWVSSFLTAHQHIKGHSVP